MAVERRPFAWTVGPDRSPRQYQVSSLICFVSGSYAKSLITNNTDQEIALLVLASLREIFGSRKVPLDDKEALSLLLENDEGPPAFVTHSVLPEYLIGHDKRGTFSQGHLVC